MPKLDYCFEPYISPYAHATKEKNVMNMIGNIPHQKFCFYHLPTQGRAGIKLGDADVSNISIIFLFFHAIILSVLDV